jgi:hypothetical protein
MHLWMLYQTLLTRINMVSLSLIELKCFFGNVVRVHQYGCHWYSIHQCRNKLSKQNGSQVYSNFIQSVDLDIIWYSLFVDSFIGIRIHSILLEVVADSHSFHFFRNWYKSNHVAYSRTGTERFLVVMVYYLNTAINWIISLSTYYSIEQNL